MHKSPLCCLTKSINLKAVPLQTEQTQYRLQNLVGNPKPTFIQQCHYLQPCRLNQDNTRQEINILIIKERPLSAIHLVVISSPFILIYFVADKAHASPNQASVITTQILKYNPN